MSHRRRRPRYIGGGMYANLSLAVVAESGGLHDTGKERGIHVPRIVIRCEDGERGDGKTMPDEKSLFADTILGDRHAFRCGRHAHVIAQKLKALGGHVFEFGGGRRAASRELGQGCPVEIVRRDVRIRHRRCRTIVPRIQHDDFVAQALRGHAEHAAQLTAAQQAEPRTRSNHDRATAEESWPARLRSAGRETR